MFDNALFLLQLAVIIGFSRLVAGIYRRLGQPQVVGEMTAGIALGPSLFGLIAPRAYESLFPAASLGYLNSLSQAGLAIFIFIVGVRVDFAEMRRQSGVALVASNVSVIAPLAMGIALSQYLFPIYGNGDRFAFALFIGTAMSVTAFPVLARILMERDLLRTRLGSIAIACAAVDDITAWILLAATIAISKHDRNARPLWVTLSGTAVYILAMLALGRILHVWSARFDAHSNQRKLPLDAIVIFLVLALVSGALAEWIGIHALVGAFMAGLATPRRFRRELIEKLEAATLLILMPLFFVLTGIRTNLIFKAGPSAYMDFAFILLIAIAGKLGGTMLGARAKGLEWREACRLGAMMNTRGLVGLIVLNVGLDSGILSPVLFSMMVGMALITTFMAVPIMDLIETDKPEAAAAA